MISRVKNTVLLVGDQNSARRELREAFWESFNILEAENALQAAMLLNQNRQSIALCLMDLPNVTEEEIGLLMAATGIKPFSEDESEAVDVVPTVAVVGGEDASRREEHAYMLGAVDVIVKPFSVQAIQRRIQTIVDLYASKWNLERMVKDQSRTIRNANQVMMDALSAIIEYRSTESGNHVLRIRRFTKILLEEVARTCPEYGLTEDTIEIIASASALHDIGKISIPDEILNKPGPLTKEEFETMKTHTRVGSLLVEQLSGMGEETYLRYAYNIALYHHERWTGLGYPMGLVGDEIPICAQVVGLTDAFDALTTKRVYKPAFPYQQAVNMILNGECGEFSPKLLECFKHVRQEFAALAQEYADGYSPKSDNITMPLPGPVWNATSHDSLHLAQAKNQTLLHYINATVLELDINNELYQVVYNPNPDLETIIPNADFNTIVKSLSQRVHPDDVASLQDMTQFVTHEFFRSKLRRRSYELRLFSRMTGSYSPYELSFLKVQTGESSQHIVTAIFRPLENLTIAPELSIRSKLYTSPALYGIISTALRCRMDATLPIDEGHRNLCVLLEYTEEELADKFSNQLSRVIHPDDWAMVEEILLGSRKTGNMFETEFRLLHENGTPLWVMAKGRPYVEENGEEYFYFALRDNSKSKDLQLQLLNDIERNQLLIDQTGSIVFEWDLLSDTMYVSPKWEERFGYTAVSQNYGQQLGIATHFHPDDLDELRNMIENLVTGTADTQSLDVRLADKDSRYLWSRITATIRRDRQGRPERIIGIIQDIDELKRATLILKERAERDALTKLLNKASAEAMASSYLADKDPMTLAGLMVLDLDNFKSVNDILGHMYGDGVLTQVGATLRKLFRSQDIIGRIGGDEFIVLLKDIPNKELLQDRCKTVVQTLKMLFERSMPDLNVSCSIGAALSPQHGTDYATLFRHADEALYTAKNKGKNQFKLYSSRDKYTQRSTTRIDSDDPGMVSAETFERFVFRSLYESHDLPTTINDLLAFVGENFGVSRAYIFENNEDNTACSNTFEWCDENTAPEIDNLQNVSYIDDIPGWPEVYDEDGILYCQDISELAPQFRAVLEPQGIKSMLQVAIRDQGVFRGYIGFDECTHNRLWSQDQLDKLSFLAENMSVFLLRYRDQQQ